MSALREVRDWQKSKPEMIEFLAAARNLREKCQQLQVQGIAMPLDLKRQVTELFEQERRVADLLFERRLINAAFMVLAFSGTCCIASAVTRSHLLESVNVAGSVISALITALTWTALRRRLSSLGARVGMDLAVLLAGKRRGHLRDEWINHLIGIGPQGGILSDVRDVRAVLGFVRAGAQMRARDLLGPIWRPVDWALTTERRLNGLVLQPVVHVT